MAILVSKDTRVVIQGITGKAARFHLPLMQAYGTQIVAGVTPGRGGDTVDGVAVFDSVGSAVANTGCNVSLIFVPAPFAADAILEAADGGVDLVVCLTEGIPVLDMLRVKRILAQKDTRLLGPNTPGILAPGPRVKVGILPDMVFTPGPIGVISRSGTLTYEAVAQLTELGLGQSAAMGIGGDPIIGYNFIELLAEFEADPETEGIVLIGEIGGNQEELAAEYIKKHVTKPVTAFIAGKTAPKSRRMGHAGAVITGGKGTAKDKIAALEAAGIAVAPTPADIGRTMKEAMK